MSVLSTIAIPARIRKASRSASAAPAPSFAVPDLDAFADPAELRHLAAVLGDLALYAKHRATTIESPGSPGAGWSSGRLSQIKRCLPGWARF